MRRRPLVALLALALVAPGVTFHRTSAEAADSPYLVGRGISDVTGPAAENGMMGYSKFGQTRPVCTSGCGPGPSSPSTRRVVSASPM
jgi:hypothetical protein